MEENCGFINSTNILEGYCTAIFQEMVYPGICWPSTAPNTTLNQSCPMHGMFHHDKLIFRTCLANGNWSSEKKSYSTCINHDLRKHAELIEYLWKIGHIASLIPLSISIIIFISFRSLRCTRIRIHIQLFISFLLNNILSLIRQMYVKDSENTSDILCNLINILLSYYIVANYFWMFCEGLYLHISLVVVFHRDKVAWLWCLLIGWGLPAIITLIYTLIRMFYMEDTHSCWSQDSFAFLIIQLSVAITLLSSLVFLINVLRVILRVTHDNNNLNPTQQRIKKAARAALVLIPLLGLQYIVIAFKPDQPIFDYLEVFVTVSQGVFVSIIFCFANNDVQYAIQHFISRKLRNSRLNNYTGGLDSAGNSSAHNTQSIRLM